MEQYRTDQYDSVHELENGSYYFIGKLNGRTLAEFIADQEDQQ